MATHLYEKVSLRVVENVVQSMRIIDFRVLKEWLRFFLGGSMLLDSEVSEY